VNCFIVLEVSLTGTGGETSATLLSFVNSDRPAKLLTSVGSKDLNTNLDYLLQIS
jgi:hypothetical protein